jgi:hypothetical protein
VSAPCPERRFPSLVDRFSGRFWCGDPEQFRAAGWRRGMIESMEDATLLDLFASLSREISGVKEELSQEIRGVKDVITRVEARLALHGGLLNGGARQVTRLIEWSEKVNEILAERDARIEELFRRVEKLEGKT